MECLFVASSTFLQLFPVIEGRNIPKLRNVLKIGICYTKFLSHIDIWGSFHEKIHYSKGLGAFLPQFRSGSVSIS